MRINYIIIPLVTVLVAAIGSWLTSIGMEWYGTIATPAWTPSGSVIGTVWTVLFILAAASALMVWNLTLKTSQRKWIAGIFSINALLNVLWSFIFFNQHLIGLAVWEAGLLGLSVVVLIIFIWPISRPASLLLVPYAAWVAFATFLTFSILTLQPPKIPAITVSSFKECMVAGYPVLESYPRQCQTADGKTFIEDIGNELEKSDLIIVNNPRPNQIIQSPLLIEGQARGYWFFEADFPIKLLDEKGNLIASAIARAQGDWMTNNFVAFEAELKFEQPAGEAGTVVLEKDNPSGLTELADELRIPVTF